MKLLLRIILWLFIGLIIALILVPFLFKGELHNVIKEKLNEQIHAEVEFEDLQLSLFSAFPSVSISINDLRIDGVDAFEDTRLFSSKSIDLTTDFKSLIKSEEGINIKSIVLDEPKVNIIINAEGVKNFDIMKDKTESQSEKDFFGEVEHYEIKNGAVSYNDHAGDVYADAKGIDHVGKGNFKSVIFDLQTETEIDILSASTNGISYLNSAKLTSDLDLGVNLEKGEYLFKENNTNLNDLQVTLVGLIKEVSSGYDMNIDVTAPNNSVSSLISLIPNSYKGNFSNISSTGNSFVEGTIKGLLASDSKKYPKIDFKANIDNGTIKYPELPIPINDINLDLLIKANNSDWSDLSVDIGEMTFVINEDRMVGKMNIQNALNNPTIDGLLNGTIDLTNLSNAFPLPDLDINSGIVKTNMTIKASSDDITNKNYGAMDLSGDVEARGLDLKYDKWPIKIKESKANLSPKKITTNVQDMVIGESDFNGTLILEDPLALTQESDLKAKTVIDLESKHLNVDELFAINNSAEGTKGTNEEVESVESYKQYEVEGSYAAEKITYEDYNLDKLSSKFTYNDDKLTLKSTDLLLDDSAVSIRGEASNIIDYTFLEEDLTGKFYLEADKINLDNYISDEHSADDSDGGIFVVEKNLDLTLYPEVNELTYGKYVFNDLDGKIELTDGIAQLKEGIAKVLGGKINLDGIYDTSTPTEPAFDVRYKLDQLPFKKLFNISSSFKSLAPLAKYVEGAFNSTLVMAGPLKDDMMPDLSKVTASGFLETLKGQVQGFEPMEKIGNALGIDKLKNWSLDGTKNWFDVKNGFVILKPHDHQVDDMVFTVAGNHGIDQSLDYTINAKIPRDKLRKDKLGKNVEFGMEFLEKEASSRGVNINLGEMIYLDIFLTGTIKNPKLKVIPVGSGGKTLQEVVKDEVTQQVDKLKDTIQTELEERTEVLKDTVTKVVTEKTDELKNKAEEKVNEEVDKKKEKIKDLMKDKVDTTIAKVVTDTLQEQILDKAKDVLGDQHKETIDDLKDKVKDWNPFKKKGGGN